MTESERLKILSNAKEFFRKEVISAHLEGACKRASSLNGYKINPFLLTYLANFLEGNSDAKSIAKALVYPRLLSTSITTIFGNKVQKMIPEIFDEMMGSTTVGIDIEFVDAIDKRKKILPIKGRSKYH